MLTIETTQQLHVNLDTLRRYLDSSREAERVFARKIVRAGLCFVVVVVDGQPLFAPSRFVGYRRNSMTGHQRNETKDGRVTNIALRRVLGANERPHGKVEREYQAFCRTLGIVPRTTGPFGVARKFWDLREKRRSAPSLTLVNREFEEEVQRSRQESPEVRRARLRRAPKKPKRLLVAATAFRRNPDVVAEVLHRARGHCESCKKRAPFVRRADGSPYLEVHHRVLLAHGGDDTVENAIAVCPNCHRREHFG